MRITTEPEEEPETVEPESISDLLETTPINNPVLPAINSYGSALHTRNGHAHHDSLASVSSTSSLSGGRVAETRPLLPSTNPAKKGILGGVSRDLIPFSGVFSDISRWFGHKTRAVDEETGVAIRDRDLWTHVKHRPRIAGGGDNVPLQVIRCLTSWLSVLEERGSVPGKLFVLQ